MADHGYSDFEKQIARIHRALAEADAEVTWNDRLPDPDNSNQGRQIDVTIRRATHLTLIECRKRKAPQDVTWVEELYGRRISLHANSVIGVSASGFSQGAVQKAQSLGVILRDFDSVTLEEALRWGEPSTLWTVYYEFRDFTVWLERSIFAADGRATLSDAQGRPLIWRTLLLEIAKRYDVNAMADQFVRLEGQIAGAFLVNNVLASKLSYSCRMRGRQQEVQAPSVGIYSDPVAQEGTIEARVDRFSVGQSEVIKGPQLASIIIDLSVIKVPDRSIFGMAGVRQDGGMRVREMQIVGANSFLQCNVAIGVRPIRQI
jgi:hypothetical protein